MSNHEDARPGLDAPTLSGAAGEMAGKQVLSFELGPQTYGLEVAYIYEVSRMVAITDLPDSPPDTIGVIDYRGTVIPVIDLRARFGMESLPHTLITPILIAWTGRHAVGLIVDKILEVRNIAPGECMAPEDFGQYHGAIAGVATVEDGLMLVVNPARLLSEEAVQRIQEAAAADG